MQMINIKGLEACFLRKDNRTRTPPKNGYSKKTAGRNLIRLTAFDSLMSELQKRFSDFLNFASFFFYEMKKMNILKIKGKIETSNFEDG